MSYEDFFDAVPYDNDLYLHNIIEIGKTSRVLFEKYIEEEYTSERV